MKAHNFEVYNKNPLTGETGWDIKFPTVFAESVSEAKQIMKNELPHFDCVILHNYSVDIEDGSEDAKAYASGVNFYFPQISEIYN